jgi:hypothetical protein
LPWVGETCIGVLDALLAESEAGQYRLSNKRQSLRYVEGEGEQAKNLEFIHFLDVFFDLLFEVAYA